MPSASNGPLQATGPRPSPSRDGKVPGPSRLARTCANRGVRRDLASQAPPRRPRCRRRGPTDRRRPSHPPGRAPPPTSVRVPRAAQQRSSGVPRGTRRVRDPGSRPSGASPFPTGGSLPPRGRRISYLVDPASSHMLVSKIKPCMSKYRPKQGETANGSLNQLWFIGSYPFLLG